jgi:hypothetical protein
LRVDRIEKGFIVSAVVQRGKLKMGECNMQNWEYCAVTYITGDTTVVSEYYSSHLIMFGPHGIQATKLANDSHSVAQAIAALGMDGWEMVGCGNSRESYHNLYFKRLMLCPKAVTESRN